MDSQEMNVSLKDIHDYFDSLVLRNKHKPIIGNYNARMLIPLLFPLRNVSIIVRGEAGSGKSNMIKGAVQLVWGGEALDDKLADILVVSGSSEKGLLSSDVVERIQKDATHCIIPELEYITNSKININVLKSWTEGEQYKYARSEMFGRATDVITLRPLPILTALANENQELQELGEEMERRFLPIFTESSCEMNKLVQRKKAEIEALPEQEIIKTSSQRILALREHINFVFSQGFGNSILSPGIKNPTAPYFVDKDIIPSRFTIAHTYIDYWHEIVHAIGSFHCKNRMIVNTGATESALLCTPEDNFLAWMIGGKIIVEACLRLKDMGRVLMNSVPTIPGCVDGDSPEARNALKIEGLLDILESQGFIRSKQQIEHLLAETEACGYIKSCDVGRNKRYWKTKEYMSLENEIDWNEAIDFTESIVKRYYPEIAKEYIHDFCADPVVKHPFEDGKKIKLRDIKKLPDTREPKKEKKHINLKLFE